MADHSVSESTPAGVPAPPPDAENPALIDLEKTFKWTVLTAIGFMAAAAFIILRTRMG